MAHSKLVLFVISVFSLITLISCGPRTTTGADASSATDLLLMQRLAEGFSTGGGSGTNCGACNSCCCNVCNGSKSTTCTASVFVSDEQGNALSDVAVSLYNGNTYYTDEYGTLSIDDLAKGFSSIITATKSDYTTARTSFNVQSSTCPMISIILKKSGVTPPATTCSALFMVKDFDTNANIVGALISINSISPTPKTLSDGSVTIQNLTAKSYSYMVTATGYDALIDQTYDNSSLACPANIITLKKTPVACSTANLIVKVNSSALVNKSVSFKVGSGSTVASNKTTGASGEIPLSGLVAGTQYSYTVSYIDGVDTYAASKTFTYQTIQVGSNCPVIVPIDLIKNTPATYKVTYIPNGGSNNVPTDTKSPYLSNATVAVLAADSNLVRSGYTFSGWAIDNAGTIYKSGTATSSFTMPAKDVVLYAQWTALQTYKVTYVPNGGSNNVPTDTKSPYLSNATVTVLAADSSLVRSGYTFSGWSIDNAGTVYKAGTATSSFTMPAKDVVLYAQWTKIPLCNAKFTFYDADAPTQILNTVVVTLNINNAVLTSTVGSGYVTVVPGLPSGTYDYSVSVPGYTTFFSTQAFTVDMANNICFDQSVYLTHETCNAHFTIQDATPPYGNINGSTLTYNGTDYFAVDGTVIIQGAKGIINTYHASASGYTSSVDANYAVLDGNICPDETIRLKSTACDVKFVITSTSNSVTNPVANKVISFVLDKGTANEKTTTVTTGADGSATIPVLRAGAHTYELAYMDGNATYGQSGTFNFTTGSCPITVDINAIAQTCNSAFKFYVSDGSNNVPITDKKIVLKLTFQGVDTYYQTSSPYKGEINVYGLKNGTYSYEISSSDAVWDPNYRLVNYYDPKSGQFDVSSTSGCEDHSFVLTPVCNFTFTFNDSVTNSPLSDWVKGTLTFDGVQYNFTGPKYYIQNLKVGDSHTYVVDIPGYVKIPTTANSTFTVTAAQCFKGEDFTLLVRNKTSSKTTDNSFYTGIIADQYGQMYVSGGYDKVANYLTPSYEFLFTGYGFNNLIPYYSVTPSIDGWANGLALQSVNVGGTFEDMVVLAGFSNTISSGKEYALTRYHTSNSPGKIDSTFGSDGIVTKQINNNDIISSIAIDPQNNKIFVGGTSNFGVDGGGYNSVLAKFSDGSNLDSTFGDGGFKNYAIVGNEGCTNVNNVWGDHTVTACSQHNNGFDYAIPEFGGQYNGLKDVVRDIKITYEHNSGIWEQKIIAVGESGYDYNNLCNVKSRIFIAKFDSSGALVPHSEFNDGTTWPPVPDWANYCLGKSQQHAGVVFTDIASSDGNITVAKMAIDSSGRIVVVGSAVSASGKRAMRILRYNSDGTLDTSFGYKGMTGMSIGQDSLATAVTIERSTGKIIVVGSYHVAGNSTIQRCTSGSLIQGQQYRLVLIRLNSDGSFDESFNKGLYDPSTYNLPYDHGILLGYVPNPNNEPGDEFIHDIVVNPHNGDYYGVGENVWCSGDANHPSARRASIVQFSKD